MQGIQQAQDILLIIVLIVLAVLVCACLIRAILGPRITDRIVAVNMIGPMVIMMIAILAVLLGEDSLADVSLIYAMISFLAVVVLTKVYTGVWRERHSRGEQEDGKHV